MNVYIFICHILFIYLLSTCGIFVVIGKSWLKEERGWDEGEKSLCSLPAVPADKKTILFLLNVCNYV